MATRDECLYLIQRAGPSLVKMLMGMRAGLLFAVVSLAGFTLVSVRACRAENLSSEIFVIALALGIVLELVLIPNAPQGLYNGVMLLPVIMGFWKFRDCYSRPALKPLYNFAVFWFVAPWLISVLVASKAALKGRPVPPTFAPFNIALFFPIMLLVLIVTRLAHQPRTQLNTVSERRDI